MIKKIKRFFSFFLIFFNVLGLLIFLSLRSEQKHLEHCQDLGVPCSSGQIQKVTESTEEWYEKVLNIPWIKKIIDWEKSL